MKPWKFCLLILASLACITGIKAQTADGIISKHIDAIGGKDKINSIISLYIEGSTSAMGNENPSTTTILNGKGYKNESEFNGQKIVQCYTDKGGWMINPMAGSTDAQPIPDDQYKSVKEQINVGGALMNYASKGYKAELLANEKVGDADAYQIRLTGADSSAATYYFDANSYYLLKVLRSGDMMGQPVDITVLYSDFRKTDYGYVMPFA